MKTVNVDNSDSKSSTPLLNKFSGQVRLKRLETFRKRERVPDDARAFPRRIRRLGEMERGEVGDAEGGADAQCVFLD